jgi:hypothetical protein
MAQMATFLLVFANWERSIVMTAPKPIRHEMN